MNTQQLMEDAINRIASERTALVDAFIVAILQVRQDIGEDIDMNYIALEYGSDMTSVGNFKTTVKVVYTKGAE